METQTSPAIFPPATVEPWLDSREAATVLKIHHKTLERKAREGAIPGYQRFSRWYFRRSELDAWLMGALQSGSQPCRVN
jgi:excisionase family DNA binding protein